MASHRSPGECRRQSVATGDSEVSSTQKCHQPRVEQVPSGRQRCWGMKLVSTVVGRRFCCEKMKLFCFYYWQFMFSDFKSIRFLLTTCTAPTQWQGWGCVRELQYASLLDEITPNSKALHRARRYMGHHVTSDDSADTSESHPHSLRPRRFYILGSSPQQHQLIEANTSQKDSHWHTMM